MGDTAFEEIGFESGLQSGLTCQWSGMNTDGSPNPAVQGVAGAPQDGHGSNFFIIPIGQRVAGYRGSIVIKQPGIELLLRICAGMGSDFDAIDTRHNITPLLNRGTGDPKTDIEVDNLPPNPHLTGDGYKGIWIERQAINATGVYTGSGRGFEIQLTFILVPA
jgi:hypothetical protein